MRIKDGGLNDLDEQFLAARGHMRFGRRIGLSGLMNLNIIVAVFRRQFGRKEIVIGLTDNFGRCFADRFGEAVVAERELTLEILAPDEIEPELQGDWRLRDSEGVGTIDVSVSPGVLQAYRQRLAVFTQELASFAHAYAMTYTLIHSDTAIIDVVQRLLRQIELVR